MITRARLRHLTLAALAVCLHSGVAVAADWAEMGPVQGTVQGHVWSKVIDESGQAKGRNEVWLLKLVAPARPEFIVLCPDPSSLEALVQWKSEYGESLEYKLDRVPTGFRKKFSSAWDPKKSRDIRILITTRQASADQHYQLTVNLLDESGQPQAGTAGPERGQGDFAGLWIRSEGGRLVEAMDISVSAQAVEIIFRDRPGGPETGRATGRLTGGRLEAANARRRITATLTGLGRLAYTSTNLDGSSPWSGEFVRQP
jgi:hypothetical protein